MLCLPLLLALVCLLGSAPARPPCPRHQLHPLLHDFFNLEKISESSAERSARYERSPNISDIIGTSRQIRLIVGKRWHLQIFPDGTVNGTNTDIDGDFSIMQRDSMSLSKVTIQGVATCQYLCMDSCGLLYGSRHYTDDCVFHEAMQPQYFNFYSSVKYSNDKKTLYLGFTRKGLPRKVQTKSGGQVGRATIFSSVLTKRVNSGRVEQLAKQMLESNPMNSSEIHLKLRHRGFHKLCDYIPMMEQQEHNLKRRCHKQKKKKKRKCDLDDVVAGAAADDDCELPPRLTNEKCENGEDEDECQRRLHMTRKKRKSRMGDVDHERLRLEKRKDYVIQKCLHNGNSCLSKRRKQNNKKTSTTMQPDIATESLLWQDHLLGNNNPNAHQLKPDDTNLSSDWTTSSATPN